MRIKTLVKSILILGKIVSDSFAELTLRFTNLTVGFVYFCVAIYSHHTQSQELNNLALDINFLQS